MPSVAIYALYAILFLFGTIVGSFLNVIVLRTEKDQEIVKTPSHCDNCGYKLKPWENIPLFSYLFLRGRCSHCKQKISLINPVSEATVGLLFMLVFWRFLQIPFFKAAFINTDVINVVVNFIPLFLWLLYVGILFLISIYDIRNLVVLDGFLVAGFSIGLIGEGLLYLINKYQAIVFLDAYHNWLGGASFFFPEIPGIFSNILGLIIGFCFIKLIVWLSKGRAMGDGDPYIAGFIGFILGTPAVFAFLFLSFIIGGIGCFILIVSRKKQFKQYVAFGPYLALGGLLTFLWGERILQMYFNLMTLH